ncbi:UBA-like protein [Dioscorea alata]|uniref:UBA-like protein n=2 Tax=Dioscorea alata TaxID=55571 RepID=A0ACB7W8V0_DIOAL|nr:UBA-like protein [Dioscorea alata]
MSARVSIPGSVRRTIQDIKEIARNHSDEEVYAMLKECAMDPNETAQRLLLQDTFHEVKRKRDKRKENTKEFTDSRWRPGLQGRGNRGGRGSFSARYAANEVNSGRHAGEKENRINQSTEKNTGSTPSPIMHDAEIKSTTPLQSSVGVLANGPSNAESLMPLQGHISQEVGVNCILKTEENSATESIKKGPLADAKINTASRPSFLGSESPDQLQSAMRSAPVAGVYASASDPVLVPSFDTRAPALVGAIKREVGNKQQVEKAFNSVVSHDVADSALPSIGSKESSELQNNHTHGKLLGKEPAVEANQQLDAPQDASSSLVSSVGSRPSTNYSSRSQQQNAPHKVGAGKEWKAKPTQVNSAQVSGVQVTSDIVSVPAEAVGRSLPASSSTGSEDALPKLQKKLEDLHFSDTKLVIIPNHLQVPESERSGFSFGSFDANFGLSTHSRDRTDSEKSSTPLSETSEEIEENVEEPSSSIQVPPPTTQEVAAYPEDPHSSTEKQENLPSMGAGISSGGPDVQEYDQSKPESTLASEGPQHSVIHTTPTYSTLGLVPQMLSQFATFEGTENQPRDASRLPSFVLQHHFDPSASYYTPFYRPPIDGDGRFSPFLPPGAAAKFNGNIAVVPAQTGQSPQESGNSLVVSSAVPTPVATQAAGVIQSSIPVTQQPVPVFRQPAGVHISHYHPNYLPYSQYISPFFVPPANIHPFLSNAAFPQQPPTGGIFTPAAPAPSATPVKYTISQFKSGTNSGNSTHVGMPTGYGTYNLSTAGYSPNPTVTSGNSTSNEDLTLSQFKENSVYMTGQQSEGSAVWIPAPGRDIPALQPSSFYSLPSPGQPLSFAPSQAGHGAFTGIYHPTQTVAATAVHPLLPQSQPMSGAVEMVGPPAGVYQQQQRAQINWTNNY